VRLDSMSAAGAPLSVVLATSRGLVTLTTPSLKD
jgi:hypothetical protein